MYILGYVRLIKGITILSIYSLRNSIKNYYHVGIFLMVVIVEKKQWNKSDSNKISNPPLLLFILESKLYCDFTQILWQRRQRNQNAIIRIITIKNVAITSRNSGHGIDAISPEGDSVQLISNKTLFLCSLNCVTPKEVRGYAYCIQTFFRGKYV